jgi:hypothetical protein
MTLSKPLKKNFLFCLGFACGEIQALQDSSVLISVKLEQACSNKISNRNHAEKEPSFSKTK